MATKTMPPSTTVTPATGDKIIIGDVSDSERLKSVLVSGLQALFQEPLVLPPVTIAVDDTTPDVSGGNIFITQANTQATEITDLDNPTAGQTLIIIGGSDTNSSTISDSGNFHLSAGWTASEDDTITLCVKADNYYVEVTRSNN